MTEPLDPLGVAGDLVARALKAGADAADAVAMRDTSLSVNWRAGALEDLERSEAADMGLRVFVGRRQAIVSTTDPTPATLDELVERAVAMARIAPQDDFAGLADPDLLAGDIPDLELDAAGEPDPQRLMDMAAEAEDAARAIEGVTNSEGAAAGWDRTFVALAASNGFSAGYTGTTCTLSAVAVAGSDLGMEREWEARATRHIDDLPDPTWIGRRAGERAVSRLKPGRLPTRAMPVVFDPRAARSLLGHLTDALSGPSIARGTSFLLNRMGEQVFAPGITVVEDPLRKRGLRSRPFDGEGLATRRRNLVEDGRLTTWLLDCRSARQLELQPTGHAARGPSSPPSPSVANLWLEPGSATPVELMEDIAEGFYICDLIGFGVNGITGDYSRGASGFRIQNGELTTPVSEVTIAGNLKTMFANLRPANDLELLHGTDTPTLRIDGMTVAGT